MSEHAFYKCPPGCEEPHCNFCEGGLAFCEVCRCGEGDLPSECPGKPVDTDSQIQIYNSALDFIEGRWRTIPGNGGSTDGE